MVKSDQPIKIEGRKEAGGKMMRFSTEFDQSRNLTIVALLLPVASGLRKPCVGGGARCLNTMPGSVHAVQRYTAIVMAATTAPMITITRRMSPPPSSGAPKIIKHAQPAVPEKKKKKKKKKRLARPSLRVRCSCMFECAGGFDTTAASVCFHGVTLGTSTSTRNASNHEP